MIAISTLPKYKIVAQDLAGKTGSLLDIGARDRVLKTYLGDSALDYKSADLGAGHDYTMDLESKLELADGTFDYMVCLDVLEHLENIHACFDELCRVTKRDLYIALPCMSALSQRISFLFRGRLTTDKYHLLPQHQGDRHRWLTVYGDSIAMINARARNNGFTVTKQIDQIDESCYFLARFKRPITILLKAFPALSVLFIGRVIFVVSKDV